MFFIKRYKRIELLVTTLFLATVFLCVSSVKAADQKMTGYAWADTIGWIQMSGGWIDEVTFDNSTGVFFGYAWSENIGWVNFAPSGSYPSSPNNSVKLNTANGELSGWAQVESIKDCSGGWEGCGWISMRGSGYGVKFDLSTGEIAEPVNSNRWAWSSDFGWIDFSAVKITSVSGGGADTYNYIDHYNYSDEGILVYTSANGPFGNYNATVGGLSASDKEIIYTLTITNPHWDTRIINLKFDLPPGFSYQGMTNGPNSSQSIGFLGPGNLTWQNYPASPGESSISFKILAP